MSYVTYPHFCREDAGLGLTVAGSAGVRRSVGSAVRNALSVIGGGVLFAATMYLMIVLPGLF